MRLTLIAAVAENDVIGHGDDIPWRLPEDWRRFKQTTMGHHLIMGRKTWDSIGRPLPGRRTVVISRGEPNLPTGVDLAHSLEEALDLARETGENEAFVAGGAEIYRLALPHADRLLLTRVHATPKGATRFPEWEDDDWRQVSEERHEADDRHAHAFTFREYERVHR